MWGQWGWGYPGNLAPEQISQLPLAAQIALTDLTVLDQNNGNGTWTTRSATLQQLLSLFNSSLPSQLPTQTIVDTTGLVNISASSGNVLVKGTGAFPMRLFPSASATRPLFLKDYTGIAYTNNQNGSPFTILANGTETIDGQASATLTINYQGIYLFPYQFPLSGWYVG